MKDNSERKFLQGYMIEKRGIFLYEDKNGFYLEEWYFDDKSTMKFDTFAEALSAFELFRRCMFKDLVLERYIDLEYMAYERGEIIEMSDWVDMENGSLRIE